MFGESNLHAVSDGLRVLRTLFTEWRRARATRRLERSLDVTLEPVVKGASAEIRTEPRRLTAYPFDQRPPSRRTIRPFPDPAGRIDTRSTRLGRCCLCRVSGVALPELARRGAAHPRGAPREAGDRPGVLPDDALRRPHRLQPVEQPRPDRRLRRADRRGDPARAQGPAAGAHRVGRQGPADPQVPPAALRGPGAERRRAGAGDRAAAARRPGARRAEDPHRPAARLRRPRRGRGRPRRPGRPARAAGPRAAPPARPARQPLGAPAGRRPGGRRRGRRGGAARSTASRCWPPAARPATSGCGRRTTRWRRRTPTTWSTSCSDSSRSSAGCSTGSRRTPTAARWSRSAAARAT